MRPASFSATSLQTADGCLSRYYAEVIQRGRGPAGYAATTGLVCHETLEHFLRGVFIRGDLEWSRSTLDSVFNAAYEKIAGVDHSLPEYADAYGLILKWFSADGRREYFDDVKIMSLEAKNSFPIPVIVTDPNGKQEKINLPVNYIMDRVDRIGPGEYKVVDYKTNWVPLTVDQLRLKIQARLYALALQIVHKDAKRIWVEFDFLRHESVAIVLTKEDQADTWRMLKRATQRIIDTPDEDAAQAETINSDCVWCVKKTTCKALTRNIEAGGIHSLTVVDKAVRFSELKARIKALEIMQGELQDELIKELIAAKTIDLDLETVRIRLKRASRRRLDNEAILKILGPELAAEVGTFTLGAIDDLKKTRRLTPEQIAKIDAAITVKWGDPGIEVALK